jgi:hypothetical protein
MITNLTDEQKARIPEVRDHWIGLGLSCGKIDPNKVVPLVQKSYENVDLQPPKLQLFVDSPLSALYTYGWIMTFNHVLGLDCEEGAALYKEEGKEAKDAGSALSGSRDANLEYGGRDIAQEFEKGADASVMTGNEHSLFQGISFGKAEIKSPKIGAGIIGEVWHAYERQDVSLQHVIEWEISMDIMSKIYAKVYSGNKDVPFIQGVFEATSRRMFREHMMNLAPSLFIGSYYPARGMAIMREHIKNATSGKRSAQSVVKAIKDTLREKIDNYVSGCGERMRSQMSNFCYGNQEYWLSFYDYFIKIGVELPKVVPLIKLASECHWWLPYEEVAIISTRPDGIYRNENGLHKDGGPAVGYPDEFAVWSLNGVIVSKELAEATQNANAMDFFLKESNVEVRREVVRKFGVERLEGVGKVIDSSEEHNTKLVDLSEHIQGSDYAPYLFFNNASIPEIRHGEPVGEECRTVGDAWAWRNKTVSKPKELT